MTNNATHEPEKNSQLLNEIERHFSAGRSFQSYIEFQSYQNFNHIQNLPDVDDPSERLTSTSRMSWGHTEPTKVH